MSACKRQSIHLAGESHAAYILEGFRLNHWIKYTISNSIINIIVKSNIFKIVIIIIIINSNSRIFLICAKAMLCPLMSNCHQTL